MSQPEIRSSDADVVVQKDAARDLLVKALAMIAIPLVLALLWIGMVREQNLKNSASRAVATAAVAQQASTLASQVDGVNFRLQALAERLPDNTDGGDRPDLLSAFPEAQAAIIVPLDDLGTVPLTPDQLGHNTHIGIDLIRRTYAGETSGPEALLTERGGIILYANVYGKTEPKGVILIEIDADVLQRSLSNETKAGTFALVQGLSTDKFLIAGTALKSGQIAAQIKVANTSWELQFQPSASWISQTTPGWMGLLIPIALILLGLVIGAYYLLWGTPLLLRQEVDRILEAAELRSTMTLQVPELQPLAKLLRQLSLLSRRQLISAARAEKDSQQSQNQPVNADAANSSGAITSENYSPENLDEESVDTDDGIPAHIFRAYDIRGDVNTELTIDLVERIGNAIAVLAPQKEINTLLLAHDGDPGSEQIRTVLVKSLLAGGIDVMDIGLAPAPLLYFGTHETDVSSAIMITGSQHDDNINGFKLIFDHSVVSGDGIEEILSTVRAGHKVTGSGRTIKRDLEADYVDKIVMDVGLALPKKIVVDDHFGAAGRLAPDLFSALGCEVVSLKSSDRAHDRQTWTLEKTLKVLGESVVAQGADLGVLFNSDGDCVHTVTNSGAAVPADRLLMILAQDVLARNPGADIVYDVKCSRHFAPFITRAGGRALMSRSGHAFIREKVRETGALLGGEFSGHIFLSERWYGFDDGIYAAARLVELLSTTNESFDSLFNKLPPSVSTPEIILAADAKIRRRLMRSLAANANFPGARITTLDGMRIDYSDGWGLVRSSSSEEALTFRFEGNDETSLARVQGVIRKAILEYVPDLALPF